MILKLKALLAVPLLTVITSSVLASSEAPRYMPGPTSAIPMAGVLALTCAMVQDFMGNDQLWFENVTSIFPDEESTTRKAAKNILEGQMGLGEPIQVRGMFRRWVGPNAFMLGAGRQEVLVVGNKNLLSNQSLNPNNLWVAGSYFNGLDELCRKGYGAGRFIRAERVFSNAR